MSDEELKSLDPDSIDDVSSFREMMRQLQTLVMKLNALVVELRSSLAEKDAHLAEKDNEIAELRRALLGPKSERKQKKASKPKSKKSESPKDKERRRQARRKSKKNRDERNDQLDEQPVEHSAADVCPKCGGTGPFVELSPEVSVEIEYLGERLLKLLHRIEKKLCPCGHIFSAPSPERVTEGTHYGPGLYANVVSKCADALPLNRISKRFARSGVKMARSTLTDLYHRAAELLAPIHRRLQALVASSFYINADETSQPVMDKDHCHRGFIWTFIAESMIVYIFSATRSGETPKQLLEGTVGKLQVDGYTGYNDVCLPNGRDRVGCIAHCRRYFHKARDKCPEEADHCLGVILKLYRVEYSAAERNILGTDAHRILRERESKTIMDEWKLWLEEHKDRHTPKSPMGRAIRYTLNQWTPLTKFISDPKLRLDNNISEAALRIIALGRDSFRWVGHNVSGHNLAVLQTIVATCVANDVNPQEYISDVLIRVQNHPAARIDELLPMNWTPA